MKTSNPLVYTRKYRVNAHDVNGDKYLTILSLLRSMQECSLLHARALKTSVWDMEEEQITWVLIRKELKILEPLELDDDYTVITYPSGFEKFFAYRDYLVFNEDKKLVAAASSTWTMINTDSRKLSKIPERILKIGTPADLKFLTKADKIMGKPQSWELVDNRLVRSYDLDWNGHVSNIVLLRYMMEVYKVRGIEDQHIQNLLIHFINEADLNQEVSVEIGQSKKESFAALRSKDGKSVASSRFTLR